MRWARIAIAVAWTLTAAIASASEFSDDLVARRARVMERLGPETMLVLASAPPRRYSLDVDYEYRQDSNLYYLTGITQQETFLVLMPGNLSRREILFVRDRDEAREHWNGRLLERRDAGERSGINTVLSSAQFEPFLAALLSQHASNGIDLQEAAAFVGAIASGHARIAMPLDATALSEPLSPAQDLARRLRDRFGGFQIVDATPALTAVRLVKTSYEQQLLRKAVDISAEAQLAGMQRAVEGAYEYEVKAAIEAVHRERGAVSPAYPSIVGSGPNATILHYAEGNRRLQRGDLLLVDAACNFDYMSPDITRTYPVGGTFSDTQKALYTIVLQAQDAALASATPGATLASIHDKAVEVIKAGLLRLGLITDISGNQYRLWFTHGSTHYIGVDVHDVGDNDVPLQAGMAFVIEPGIYIRAAALDRLPRTADNDALIAAVGRTVRQYDSLGVRVEDSFLMEAAGARRLSTAVPRTIMEIEDVLHRRSVPAAVEQR